MMRLNGEFWQQMMLECINRTTDVWRLDKPMGVFLLDVRDS
jgi:hypothetical protein